MNTALLDVTEEEEEAWRVLADKLGASDGVQHLEQDCYELERSCHSPQIH